MNQDFNFCGKNVHPADDIQAKLPLLSLFNSNLEPPTFLKNDEIFSVLLINLKSHK